MIMGCTVPFLAFGAVCVGSSVIIKVITKTIKYKNTGLRSSSRELSYRLKYSLVGILVGGSSKSSSRVLS